MSKPSKYTLCFTAPGKVVSGVERSTVVVGSTLSIVHVRVSAPTVAESVWLPADNATEARSRLRLLVGLASTVESSFHTTGDTESVGCVVSTKTTASRGTGCVVAVEFVKDGVTATGGVTVVPTVHERVCVIEVLVRTAGSRTN